MTKLQNPFIYGGITPRFYGRTEEIRLVLDNLHNFPSFSVVGIVRIGKSMFLWHLAQGIRNTEIYVKPDHKLWRVVPIYIDLQQLPFIGAKHFWRVLYREMLSSLEKFGIYFKIDNPPIGALDSNAYFSVVRSLLDQLKSQNVALILLLDEFDEILVDPDFDHSYLGQLRYLASSGGYFFSLVTSTKKNLLELTFDPEKLASPFFNIFSVIRIGLMNEEEIRELVTESLVYGGAESGFFTQDDIDFAIDVAGCNPFHIQLFCNILFDFRKNKKEVLSAHDLSIIFQQFQESAEPFFSYQWSKLNERERKLIRSLAKGKADIVKSEMKIATNLVKEGLLVESKGNVPGLFGRGFEKFVAQDPAPQPLLATSTNITYETEIIEVREQINELLPSKHSFEFPGVFLAHRIIQASTISSDFYNFILREDGSLAIYMLDVIGHGFAASNQVRSIYQLLTDRPWGKGRATEELNKVDEWVKGSYILQKEKVAFCMNFMVIDPVRMVINFANAGMPYPILIRSGKTEPEVLKASGVYPGEGYSHYSVEPREVQTDIEEGELLIMVSDGIIEAADRKGELFGRKGLIQAVVDARNDTPEQIANSIIHALKIHTEYREKPEDDQALIVISIRKPFRVFSFKNNMNVLDFCLNEIEEEFIKWLEQLSLIDQEKSDKIWRATWEAILNSIKHGSSSEDELSIELHHGNGFIDVLVIQTKVWDQGNEFINGIKGKIYTHKINVHDNHFFGLTIMLSHADDISVIDSGRTVAVRFLMEDI